ncbi:hypothetical protein M422DRAFT_37567 [Sphaerobolus stellatus SS14]|uniref:Uncharacterized protein n=1 Tax=Sphaerobolus stellatus (strain SS14) TaxID=990650 RepID=A0A0C9URE0_SPHS4|nr:hypothetical protein M422DRAFT_37567 [Sphaerobolus stellatus SS14]
MVAEDEKRDGFGYAEGSSTGGKKIKDRRGSKLSKMKSKRKVQQQLQAVQQAQAQLQLRRASGHGKGASWDSGVSSLADYKSFGYAVEAYDGSVKASPVATDETMIYPRPMRRMLSEMVQGADSHTPILEGRMVRLDYEEDGDGDRGVGSSNRSRSGSGCGSDEKTKVESIAEGAVYSGHAPLSSGSLYAHIFTQNQEPSTYAASPLSMSMSTSTITPSEPICPSSFHRPTPRQPPTITTTLAAPSSHSMHSNNTFTTDTDFDFMAPTPPPASFNPHPQSPAESRPSTSSLSLSIDPRRFSRSSSARIKGELRRGEITVIDMRRVRTPEGSPVTEGGEGQEASTSWIESRRAMGFVENDEAVDLDVPTPRQGTYSRAVTGQIQNAGDVDLEKGTETENGGGGWRKGLMRSWRS